MNGSCFLLKQLTFKICKKFNTLTFFKITLYLLQNKVCQLCKLLSKIELKKYLFFSVKIHVIRVKNFDIL